MTRLATRKHRVLQRVPEWETIRISYLVGNVTEPVAERLAKKLCVRDANENQYAQRRYGDQKKENGEEKSLQQSGKAAKCGGKLLLFLAPALDRGSQALHLFLNAPDLLALAFHAGTQSAALALHLAEVAVERGEIRPVLQRRLANGDAGEHGQYFGCIG